MCLEIYGLDPAHFLFTPGILWQAVLKNTKVKLDLLTDIDMLLIVEKAIRGEIQHAIHQYAKASNKNMTNYDKNKELLYLKYWYVNSLYEWAMSETLPVDCIRWVENIFQFNEDFMENNNEDHDEKNT